MKYKLGNLIKQRREKNSGDSLPIYGISKDGFIPPKQIDADTSIYNMFYRNDFVYNPARMELGSIAYNDKVDKAICSSLYEMFYVYREDILLPQYLALIIKTKWFSDYCNFLSNGSAREYCRFRDISQIYINIPNLDEQRKIIKQCLEIKKRIDVLGKINNLLFKIMNLSYKKMKKDNEPVNSCKLEDFCEFQEGYVNPPQDNPEYFDGEINWLRAGDVNESFIVKTERTLTLKGFESAKKSAILFKPGTFAITKSGVIGRLGIISNEMCGNRAVINIKPKDEKLSNYIYLLLKDIQPDIIEMGTGSAQKNLYVSILQNIQFNYPKENIIYRLSEDIKPIFKNIEQNCKEITILNNILELRLDSTI